MAHVIVTTRDIPNEQTVELDSDQSLLMAENTYGLVDLMYRSLSLVAGESFEVPAFFPTSFEKMTLMIEVRPDLQEIEVGGVTYTVFVCDRPDVGEIDYVSEDGSLLRVERPAVLATIERVEPADSDASL